MLLGDCRSVKALCWRPHLCSRVFYPSRGCRNGRKICDRASFSSPQEPLYFSRSRNHHRNISGACFLGARNELGIPHWIYACLRHSVSFCGLVLILEVRLFLTLRGGAQPRDGTGHLLDAKPREPCLPCSPAIVCSLHLGIIPAAGMEYFRRRRHRLFHQSSEGLHLRFCPHSLPFFGAHRTIF